MELSGSLGDMGLYIPLVAALVSVNGLNITAVLFFSGLFNILSGILFSIPMCVQPMKAIATIAIADNLTVNQILAAGIITGFIIFILGATGLLKHIVRKIPTVIIRGVQVALGLKLLIKGIEMIRDTKSWIGYDSILTGIICVILIIFMFAHCRVPAALYIFSAGILVTMIGSPAFIPVLSVNSFSINPAVISVSDFYYGGILAAIPQIPLTLLNSVIAVCALSGELFPGKRTGERELAMSVGIMNMVGCVFGAMPSCHGAGGLAGQYRYGARTGGSMVFIGGVKMMLAITLGASLMPFFAGFPKSILGALLFFTGMDLVLLIKDVEKKRDLFIVFASVSGILVLNTAAGFIIGICLGYLLPHGWLIPSEREKIEKEKLAAEVPRHREMDVSHIKPVDSVITS